MAANVSIVLTNNIGEIIYMSDNAIDLALEIIGLKAEKYAKARCPVGTPESTGIKGYRGGTLRNSITHTVQENTLSVGTNVEYAPYVELGTGPYFQAPPAWEQFDAPKGKGVGHSYVRPRPYLKPAIVDHLDEYKDVIKNELENA